MDDDGFEKGRRPVDTEAAGDTSRPYPAQAEKSALSTLHKKPPANAGLSFTNPAKHAERPGIVWVRASDLLSTRTGHIAGRGIDFEAELARRMRRTPATTRRAIRERADRLPPLSEFGASSEHPTFTRFGLGRR
jgi:hypothetical protein